MWNNSCKTSRVVFLSQQLRSEVYFFHKVFFMSNFVNQICRRPKKASGAIFRMKFFEKNCLQQLVFSTIHAMFPIKHTLSQTFTLVKASTGSFSSNLEKIEIHFPEEILASRVLFDHKKKKNVREDRPLSSSSNVRWV